MNTPNSLPKIDDVEISRPNKDIVPFISAKTHSASDHFAWHNERAVANNDLIAANNAFLFTGMERTHVGLGQIRKLERGVRFLGPYPLNSGLQRDAFFREYHRSIARHGVNSFGLIVEFPSDRADEVHHDEYLVSNERSFQERLGQYLANLDARLLKRAIDTLLHAAITVFVALTAISCVSAGIKFYTTSEWFAATASFFIAIILFLVSKELRQDQVHDLESQMPEKTHNSLNCN